MLTFFISPLNVIFTDEVEMFHFRCPKHVPFPYFLFLSSASEANSSTNLARFSPPLRFYHIYRYSQVILALFGVSSLKLTEKTYMEHKLLIGIHLLNFIYFWRLIYLTGREGGQPSACCFPPQMAAVTVGAGIGPGTRTSIRVSHVGNRSLSTWVILT